MQMMDMAAVVKRQEGRASRHKRPAYMNALFSIAHSEASIEDILFGIHSKFGTATSRVHHASARAHSRRSSTPGAMPVQEDSHLH